jgi:hypothetical protein
MYPKSHSQKPNNGCHGHAIDPRSAINNAVEYFFNRFPTVDPAQLVWLSVCSAQVHRAAHDPDPGALATDGRESPRPRARLFDHAAHVNEPAINKLQVIAETGQCF